MLAIIGGSGLSELANLDTQRREVVRTPFGEPSGPLTFGRLCGRTTVFIARHGYGHSILPHEINYCANLWALAHVGVTRIVAVASVGGIGAAMLPGTLVVPHQIIDYTWGRRGTFQDGSDAPVLHIDFTHPYDPDLRRLLLDGALAAGDAAIDGAVYAATQGPRLETAAEIDRLARDGADVVGMTGMPEASLARELGLPYAAIVVVANHAAGRGESAEGISLARVETEVLQPAMARVRRILEHTCVIA